MENLDANGNPIVNPADDTGKNPPKDPNAPGAGGDDPNNKGGDDKTPPEDKKGWVPSSRLKEEADARREAEAKLKEYQDKETQEEEKKKKAQGKYEELITEKDGKIKELDSKVQTIPQYEEKISAMTDNALAGIKASIGEEKLNKILGIVWFDTLDVIWKADSLEKINALVAELAPQKPDPKGGAGIDPNKGGAGDWKVTFDSLVSGMFGAKK